MIRLSPVGLASLPVALPGGFATTRNATTAPDGRFEVAGVAPGSYRVSVTIPEPLTAAGWWPRSALANGADILDIGLEAAAGRDIADVDIVLSKQRASLAGQLRLADGRAGSDYFVIAFAGDRRAWQVDSRRTLATRPDDAGVFRIENMPPGDYFLAVLGDFEPTMLTTPGFFERATAAAARITIAEGKARQQSFEIGR